MGRLILGKHGLSDKHVEQATESPLQGDFTGLTIFMRLPVLLLLVVDNSVCSAKGCVRTEKTGSNKTCWALLPHPSGC
jgi:hypothetical protein